MSRAQDRSSGLPTGAQAAEKAAGATGTGTTSGAGATGTASTTDTTGTTGVTGTTGTTGQQPVQQTPTASYERGREPSAEWRTSGQGQRDSSGTAIGGVLSVVAGLLAFLSGLAFVVRPHFYPTLSGYAYRWPGTGWGWVLLALGIVLFAAGASVLLGIAAARPVAAGLAVLTAIAGFMFLVYSPFTGIVLVALSVFAIWGLLRGGLDRSGSRM
ncbi:MAG TPA: hypothetical protein VK802_16435 [Streptosporangiaceae bacterium]|jgi:hypothetical protein|nr:hypothetical protein [Streptosporangiaceae bacterium]